MAIQQDGIVGEQLGRTILKKYFNPDLLLQPDWLTRKNNVWHVWEIKNKNRYTDSYSNFTGTGLDISQVKARLEFQRNTGIRCGLISIEKGTNIVHRQWLDTLERGAYMDTKNNIRIYGISNFNTSEMELT